MHKLIGNFLLDLDKDNPNLKVKNKSSNTKAAVLVETRANFWLKPVMKNFRYFLGEEWNFYVFYAPKIESYIKKELEDWDINMMPLRDESLFNPVGNMKIDNYNDLLTRYDFWKQFKEEKILIYQLDTVLFKKGIEEFLEYDYIGAPCGLRADQMNGGLSLRNRDTCLDILELFGNYRQATIADPPYWIFNAEDVFYSKGLDMLAKAKNYNLPDIVDRIKFSFETYTYDSLDPSIRPKEPYLPLGMHGTDKFQVPEEIIEGFF